MAERSLIERMQGAALLNIDTYEEVEADETATGQAALVVVIVAIAQAIPAAGGGVALVIFSVISGILGWLAWSGVTYLIGDKLLGGTATWGELLRTIGFAQTPGLLYVFGLVPHVGRLLQFVIALWILVAGIIAIRQALDFSTGKAILTAILGWLAMVLLLALPALLTFGMLAGSR
jgi:hypothetical protein